MRAFLTDPGASAVRFIIARRKVEERPAVLSPRSAEAEARRILRESEPAEARRAANGTDTHYRSLAELNSWLQWNRPDFKDTSAYALTVALTRFVALEVE